MSRIDLRAVPLTVERFAPFGDVISAAPEAAMQMNAARFDRFDALAKIDVDAQGEPIISIVRSRTKTSLPYCFDTVERHPLGSQAFIPLQPFQFVVVVAPVGDDVAPSDLHAFATNGHQGVNYRRGVWHMPLIALDAGQEFLVVDRSGADNCEERVFDETIALHLQ